MKIEEVLVENKEDKKPARVIAGFPGIGKSHFKKNGDGKVLDSDSMKFSWKDKEKGERNPDFPENYLKHIKDNLYKADIILVSTHDEVRQGLKDNDIEFELVYPEIGLKDEYIKRYEDRGNDDKFIKFFKDGWDEMIKGMEKEKGPKHIVLKKGQFLADVIND